MRAAPPPPRRRPSAALDLLAEIDAERERKRVEAKKKRLSHFAPEEAKRRLKVWLATRKKHSENAKRQHWGPTGKPPKA